MLEGNDVREAIGIEHRILLRTRTSPVVVDPHHAERYDRWVAELRIEARRRVLNFLGMGALFSGRYAD